MTISVLAAGLATSLALLGLGRAALARLGVHPPEPWRTVAAALLGLQLESLAVQLLAMAGLATRPTLVALWVALAVGGLAALVAAARRDAARCDAAPRDARAPARSAASGASGRTAASRGARAARAAALAPLALGAVALVTDLLLAAAPSTKGDELYYHMLLPRRILLDGTLRFYQFPWEGAAFPQMAFQIGAAPLHALALPDAPNVVSWTLAALLAWFGWRLLADDAGARPLAAWWPAAAVAGLYSAVWQVTGGAHSSGDLALAAALVAVASRRPRAALPPRAFALLVGLLTWSAASSKIALVPVSAVLLAWGVLEAAGALPPAPHERRAARRAERLTTVLAGLAPWALFGLPIVLWTWHVSGAPLGPFFAWHFPHTVYDPAQARGALDHARALNQTLPPTFPRELLAQRTPLLWAAAAAGAVAAGGASRARRLGVLAVVALQLALVWRWLPWDPRFLSGLPYGLALLAALDGGPLARLAPLVRRPAAALAAAALLVAPWLGAQLWYARPFAAVALGLTPRDAFLRRYVPFTDDWRALDRLLPPDAILVAHAGRVNGAGAPRALVLTERDLRPAERARAWVLGTSCDQGGRGPVVYENPRAVIETYRTPGHPPLVRAVCVRALEPR